MKRKSPQSNTSNTKPRIVVSDIYMDMNDFREIPITFNGIMKICAEMDEFIEDTKVYNLGAFFYPKGISWTTISRWKEKFPEFKQRYEHAKHKLGIRREQHMLERKINDKVGMFMQGRYDPEWKEREQEINKATSESKEYVVLKNLGTSDIVPKKEE